MNHYKKTFVILIFSMLFILTISTTSAEMTKEDFKIFKINTPDESNFKFDAYEIYPNLIKLDFKNYGVISDEVDSMGVIYKDKNWTINFLTPNSKLIKSNDDFEIYKSNKSTYSLVYPVNDTCIFLISGKDLDTLYKMANSLEMDDLENIREYAKNSDALDMTNQNLLSDAPDDETLIENMNIESGSFSTDSGLSDKAYASIYVGEEFTSEDVIIQIFYSREGSILNQGNMVQKTVDSKGYINVASADPYEYYPDEAEINLYDSQRNLLDSRVVYLSPESGIQNF